MTPSGPRSAPTRSASARTLSVKPPTEGIPALSPREIYLCVKERAVAAALISVVVCALLGGWLISRPKVYQTSARLLVERSERVLDIDQVVDQSVGGGKNDAMFETYLAQITGPAMITRVLATLSPEEKLSAWRPYAEDNAKVPSNLDGVLRGIISGNSSAFRQGSTFFINVQVRHRDPRSASIIASRFASEFIGYMLDRSTSANSSALVFLREQTENLRVKAEASERALQLYRERSGMVSLDDSQNIVVDRMKMLSSTVTQARVARLAVEARLRQAEAIIEGSGDPLELAATADFASLASVQSQLDNLKTERTIMGERYGVRHPSMIENQKSREALEKLRGDLVAVGMANLRNQRAKALDEETQLQSQLKEAEKESLRLDEMAVQFNVLRREAETNRVTYSQLLNRLNETTISAQLGNSIVRVVDLAYVPSVPVEPDTRKILIMIVVMGLGIFVGYPIGLELLFNRIRGWSDVETYLNLPLLAELPQLKQVKAEDLPHLLTRANDEEASEAIRSLYAQLKLGSRLDLPKTLLVTSTLPSEGKSFVVANLAGAFAAHGLKALIVDTDLRRPTQHRTFGLQNDFGLLRWLEKNIEVPGDVMADTDLGIVTCSSSLYLLRTGGITRRSTEALDSSRIHTLLEALRKQFDIVIIDTPPAGVFPDALSLAEFADELIYVVRHNHVARPAVLRVLERFRRTEMDIAGVVLNLMPSGRGSSSYYSSYGYYGSKYYKDYEKVSKAG